MLHKKVLEYPAIQKPPGHGPGQSVPGGPVEQGGHSYTSKKVGNSSSLSRIQLQIKTFELRHLHVKFKSLMQLELIKVWLKHLAVPPGWPDKLMEPGFRGSLDDTAAVNLPGAVTQERCQPPLSLLSYLPASVDVLDIVEYPTAGGDTNQSPSKNCTHAYLSPFPLLRDEHNSTSYDSAISLAVISKANVLNKGAAHQDELQNLLFSTLATQSNVYRGFWTVLMLLGVLTVVVASFVIICAAPFASHILYKAGGGFFIIAGVLFSLVVVMYVIWVQAMADLENYTNMKKMDCSDFAVYCKHGKDHDCLQRRQCENEEKALRKEGGKESKSELMQLKLVETLKLKTEVSHL
ncbi:hypothetical protein TURU_049268 [Turdus rufiventris]|nr:hypothetical protein TURU_049268 [Turdus rufiventris]